MCSQDIPLVLKYNTPRKCRSSDKCVSLKIKNTTFMQFIEFWAFLVLWHLNHSFYFSLLSRADYLTSWNWISYWIGNKVLTWIHLNDGFLKLVEINWWLTLVEVLQFLNISEYIVHVWKISFRLRIPSVLCFNDTPCLRFVLRPEESSVPWYSLLTWSPSHIYLSFPILSSILYTVREHAKHSKTFPS